MWKYKTNIFFVWPTTRWNCYHKQQSQQRYNLVFSNNVVTDLIMKYTQVFASSFSQVYTSVCSDNDATQVHSCRWMFSFVQVIVIWAIKSRDQSPVAFDLIAQISSSQPNPVYMMELTVEQANSFRFCESTSQRTWQETSYITWET